MDLIKYSIKNKDVIYNKVIFIVETLVSLLFGISIYSLAYINRDLGYFSIPYTVLSVISFICEGVIILVNIDKYKKQIEKLFLTFVIPVGIMFVVIFPVGWAPDEDQHIYRSYDLSYGHIVTPYGEDNKGDIYVPQQLREFLENRKEIQYITIHEELQKHTNYNELIAIQTSTKTGFPLNYMIGGVVFFLCRIENINVLFACYLVKLINFILFILVGYYCIKNIPFGKLLLSIYMFLPMVMQQACSVSADTIINAASILFIVINLKLLYQEKDITFKQRLIYYFLVLNISAGKYVYVPLILMSLLLIKNKNIKKSNRNKLIIISAIISISISVFWYMFSQTYTLTDEYILEKNINPIQQVMYIISNPIRYISILLKTIIYLGDQYLTTFVGHKFGCLDIQIARIYPIIMIIGLVLLPLLEENKRVFNKKQKIIICIIALILVMLILTGLYISWTPVALNYVMGVQGRYFTPIFILLLLAMIREKENINIKNLEVKYFVLYFLMNIVTLYEIYITFM